MPEPVEWLSTKEASERLGITLRTLYKFIDEGKIDAYQMGRVFRLRSADVERFIASVKIEPGTLSHLYPDTAG